MFRPSKNPCPKCGKKMSQVAKTCFSCRKKRKTGKCKICDKKYTFVSSKKQQSCSKECAYKLRGKRSSDTQSKKVIVCCEKCGRERMVSPTYSYRRFCSTACAHEFNSGERNPNWKGGITSERSSFDSSKEF